MINIALSKTCRRVYLEAHAFPLLQKEHVLHECGGPDTERQLWKPHNCRIVAAYFERKLGKPSSIPGVRQNDLVRSARLFISLFALQENCPDNVVNESPYFHPIESLRITLRRSDWLDWESNSPPIINPFKKGVSLSEMQADMSVEGGNPYFERGAWGLAFERLPNLKTLKIDFETAEEQKAKMEQLVQWAVTWRFPIVNADFLSAQGREVEKMSVSHLLEIIENPTRNQIVIRKKSC